MTAPRHSFVEVAAVVKSVSAKSAVLAISHRGRGGVVSCPRAAIAAVDGAFLVASDNPVPLRIRRDVLEKAGFVHQGEWPGERERLDVLRKIAVAARTAAVPMRGRNGVRPSRTSLERALGEAIRAADQFFTEAAEAGVIAERERCRAAAQADQSGEGRP